jgi:hypothetical protein
MSKMVVVRRIVQAHWPKEWQKNEVCAMAQQNESVANRREGLAMEQPENWRQDVAMAQQP